VDDLAKVLRAVNKKERVAGFVADSHYGWTFVPYLQAFGGNVFRKAPDDLFPTLDTPEVIAAAEYYASLLREFGPDGAVTYTPDQVTQALKLGRVNFTDAGQLHLAQVGDPATSKTVKTVKFGLVPTRRAASRHGGARPASRPARRTRAAWASSSGRCQADHAQGGCRRAGSLAPLDIDSQEFRSRQVINGSDPPSFAGLHRPRGQTAHEVPHGFGVSAGRPAVEWPSSWW
jgi:multiple sugar transport system substrate-binding protein